MTVINGHVYYDEEDIMHMLYSLSMISDNYRRQIIYYILNNGYGMDTEALINIVSNPLEFNMDYLYSLDSAVSDIFIDLMNRFGIR